MRAELKTLFWLQWRLTRGMFRSRRTTDRLRVLGLLSRVVTFVFSLPLFAAMGVGLAVGLVLLSPKAAFELAMMTNVGLFFIWLLLPASYSSQLVDRFEMSRLFPYPIQFRSIVVGSTLMSLLTMTGMWTALLMVGEIVGLAWHQPLALPLVVLGAVPAFALLALMGRIMDDFFDLVAGDRRLRAVVLGVLSLPFVVCWLGQYIVQYTTDNYSELPVFVQVLLVDRLASLSAANGPSEFLEIVSPSRFLAWLPPGWATAGMAWTLGRQAGLGAWGQQILFLLGALVFVALLLLAHAGITRRLMEGAALSVGAERVRTHRWALRLPGPAAFWALFRKDWIYLWRSPLPRRLVFSAAFSIVAMAVPILTDSSERIHEAVPLLMGALAITMISMVANLGLTANYFGAVDREGFATLAFSALDRRYVILSGNLAIFLFTSGLYLVAMLVVGLLTRSWSALPLGMYLGVCIQCGGSPAYNLATIIGPYRTQLKFTRGRQRGNAWGLLAWAVSAVPVLALIVVPYVFWKPGLAVTLPLGAVYSLSLYLLTLKPLARLLERREHDILQAITVQE